MTARISRGVGLACALAVAAVGRTGIAPARAADGVAPISISTCTVGRAARTSYDGYPYTYDRGLLGAAPGGYPQQRGPVAHGLNITYRNTSGTVAKRVTFAVTYGGRQRRIVDRGTFSPGAQIAHTFDVFDDAPYQGTAPQACDVSSVRFADGTEYGAR